MIEAIAVAILGVLAAVAVLVTGNGWITVEGVNVALYGGLLGVVLALAVAVHTFAALRKGMWLVLALAAALWGAALLGAEYAAGEEMELLLLAGNAAFLALFAANLIFVKVSASGSGWSRELLFTALVFGGVTTAFWFLFVARFPATFTPFHAVLAGLALTLIYHAAMLSYVFWGGQLVRTWNTLALGATCAGLAAILTYFTSLGFDFSFLWPLGFSFVALSAVSDRLMLRSRR